MFEHQQTVLNSVDSQCARPGQGKGRWQTPQVAVGSFAAEHTPLDTPRDAKKTSHDIAVPDQVPYVFFNRIKDDGKDDRKACDAWSDEYKRCNKNTVISMVTSMEQKRYNINITTATIQIKYLKLYKWNTDDGEKELLWCNVT